MMAKQSPDRLAVTDRTAATMLDMSATQFSRLVSAGALPQPVTLPGGIARWRVADLVAIIDGFAAKPEEEKFEL